MSWLFSKKFLFFFFLLNVAFLQAAPYFDFNTQARTVYHKITELKLAEASQLLDAFQKDEPENLIVHHLANYRDFFTLFISENKDDYQRMERNRNDRLKIIQANAPEDSPYTLFVQAEIRLHWALLRLRFEEYLPALSDINRAHKLLLRNDRRFPSFLPNKKDLGILHAAVGTVPGEYRWALDLVSSLNGTVEQGKGEIEEVIRLGENENFPFLQETKVLYAYLLLHLDGSPLAAWENINTAGLEPEKSPLHAFVLANIAMRTGRNDDAIHYLSIYPKGPVYQRFPFLDYMLGLAKLRELDTRGKIYLQSFVVKTEGRHFIKEAYQKLAWAALLENDQQAYHSNMQYAQQRGQSTAGGDQNALREAQSGIVPNLTLLQARLLFDGGYFDRARTLLENHNLSGFSNKTQRLEYLYRFGRVLHGLKSYTDALGYYERTVNAGRDNSAFFACNAALQAGLIEETRQNKTRAIFWFEQCLSIQPADYRSSLHQQAKAGMNRLGE